MAAQLEHCSHDVADHAMPPSNATVPGSHHHDVCVIDLSAQTCISTSATGGSISHLFMLHLTGDSPRAAAAVSLCAWGVGRASALLAITLGVVLADA
jgi:hypothetical protein